MSLAGGDTLGRIREGHIGSGGMALGKARETSEKRVLEERGREVRR